MPEQPRSPGSTDSSRTANTAGTEWWRSAVIYQIYPRSFADSNGDGIGDLNGVRARLPYISSLGVDAIWLSPFYPSPQADAGYDVSDYRDVDPLFGSLDDAQTLIQESHDIGLRIVIDLVPNHTSDRHPWFQSALAANSGSSERGRYIFRDGRGLDGSMPPNNWVSNFGGSAWTRIPDGQWYLHLFASEQPDLNWVNREVIEEFQDILRFWLDLGVDGFRIDVAHGLAKDPALADLPGGESGHFLTVAHRNEHPHWDRDEVHEVYRGWRRVIDEYAGDRVFCAEAWVPNPDRFAQYLRPDELHTAFNFNFLAAPWEARAIREVIDKTLSELKAVGATATWVLSNHDVTRHPTRFGGGPSGLSRALAATLLMLALPGGAYIYQGEELGLEEVQDIPPDQRQDPIFRRSGGMQIGRDGCRVPLPWGGNEAPFEFGPAGTAWLPQPASWSERSVQAQESDPASTLNFYRSVLCHRHRHSDLSDSSLTWVEAQDGVLAFRRGKTFACVVNYNDRPTYLPASLRHAHTIVSSAKLSAGQLPASAAVWLIVETEAHGTANFDLQP